jgi:nucleoside triphosphatase
LVQAYPEATVGALVVRVSGEVLIVQSEKWGNKYTVPGGHIELGERAEDAIVREVKEETGLDCVVEELLIVQQAIYPKGFYKHEHYIFMDYVCKTKSSEVKLDGRELQSFIWVRPEEALKLDLEEYTRNFVEKYILSEKHGVRSSRT